MQPSESDYLLCDFLDIHVREHNGWIIPATNQPLLVKARDNLRSSERQLTAQGSHA
jgi:hypothetical protein